MPFGRMFDIVWSGRRHVMMGATQVDRFGNQNIACIGAVGEAQGAAPRRARRAGQHGEQPDAYWVPAAHSARVRRAGRLRVAASATTAPRRRARARPGSTRSAVVVSNKAVLDFDDAGPRDADPFGAPRRDRRRRRREHRLPAGGARRRSRRRACPPPRTCGSSARSSTPTTCATPRFLHDAPDPAHATLRAVRGRVPHRADGHGLGGRRATSPSATSNAGGLGIVAGATMTFEQLRDAIHTVKERTGNPFGVNLRPDQPDLDDRISMIVARGREGRELRRSRPARTWSSACTTAVSSSCRRSAPSATPRRSPSSVSTPSSPRAARAAATRARSRRHCSCRRSSTSFAGPVVGAGGFHDGRGLVAALAYGCRRHRHGHPLPAHPGEPRPRRR